MAHVELVGVFKIYLYTKLLTPNSSGSIVIVVERKKYIFHAAVMLRYILQVSYKVLHIFRTSITIHISTTPY
jgi:hypothetical protein